MTDELVFDPDETTIAPGDTVVWENVGQISHPVTAYEDEFPGRLTSSRAVTPRVSQRRGAPVHRAETSPAASRSSTPSPSREYGYICIPTKASG